MVASMPNIPWDRFLDALRMLGVDRDGLWELSVWNNRVYWSVFRDRKQYWFSAAIEPGVAREYEVGDRVEFVDRPEWGVWEVAHVQGREYVTVAPLIEGVRYGVDVDPSELKFFELREEAEAEAQEMSDIIADTMNLPKQLADPDAINPDHYQFSNGAEVIDISENLTSNAGQAVQYIARSCRLDGRNKGNVVEDLRKAVWFIEREIERVGK